MQVWNALHRPCDGRRLTIAITERYFGKDTITALKAYKARNTLVITPTRSMARHFITNALDFLTSIATEQRLSHSVRDGTSITLHSDSSTSHIHVAGLISVDARMRGYSPWDLLVFMECDLYDLPREDLVRLMNNTTDDADILFISSTERSGPRGLLRYAIDEYGLELTNELGEEQALILRTPNPWADIERVEFLRAQMLDGMLVAAPISLRADLPSTHAHNHAYPTWSDTSS